MFSAIHIRRQKSENHLKPFLLEMFHPYAVWYGFYWFTEEPEPILYAKHTLSYFTPPVCLFSFRNSSVDDSYRFIKIDGP